jgi:hypothetical protein
MTQDYQGQQAPQPPMPPTELVQVWWSHMWSAQIVANRAAAWAWEQAMTTLAARERAAADAELKACCNFLLSQFGGATWSDANGNTCGNMRAVVSRLHAARRPKPPTLAERGLSVLDACGDNIGPANEQELRAALLRLQEVEQATTTTEPAND